VPAVVAVDACPEVAILTFNFGPGRQRRLRWKGRWSICSLWQLNPHFKVSFSRRISCSSRLRGLALVV